MASGPIDSAIAVKPRMSLKSTVVGPPLAALADGAVLLRDVGRDVGREVALEVGADGGLAADLLGVAGVLDADGREPAERHQELQVLVGERVGGGEIVDVKQAEQAVGRRHERGAHRAPDALQRGWTGPGTGLSAGAFWETTATRSWTTFSAIDRGTCSGWVSPWRLREIVGTSSPVSSLRSTMVTRSTLMISKVMSTTVRSSRSRSSSPESFCETSSSICSLSAWRASPVVALDPELARAAVRRGW